MKAKSIQEYIPEKKELTLFSVRVPLELKQQVDELLEKNNTTLTRLVIACFEKYIDEQT